MLTQLYFRIKKQKSILNTDILYVSKSVAKNPLKKVPWL